MSDWKPKAEELPKHLASLAETLLDPVCEHDMGDVAVLKAAADLCRVGLAKVEEMADDKLMVVKLDTYYSQGEQEMFIDGLKRIGAKNVAIVPRLTDVAFQMLDVGKGEDETVIMIHEGNIDLEELRKRWPQGFVPKGSYRIVTMPDVEMTMGVENSGPQGYLSLEREKDD